MRVAGVMIALGLFVLSVPAHRRLERAAGGESLARLLWEAARFHLAVVAGTALLIVALWGAR